MYNSRRKTTCAILDPKNAPKIKDEKTIVNTVGYISHKVFNLTENYEEFTSRLKVLNFTLEELQEVLCSKEKRLPTTEEKKSIKLKHVYHEIYNFFNQDNFDTVFFPHPNDQRFLSANKALLKKKQDDVRKKSQRKISIFSKRKMSEDAYMTAVESATSKNSNSEPISTSDVNLKIKNTKKTQFHVVTERCELLRSKLIVILPCMLIPLSLFLIEALIVSSENTSNTTIEQEQPQIQEPQNPTIPNIPNIPTETQVVSTLNLDNFTSNSTNQTFLPFVSDRILPVDEVVLKLNLPSSRKRRSSNSTSLIYARNCYFTENEPVNNQNQTKTQFIEYGQATNSNLTEIIKNRDESEIIINSRIFEMRENLTQAYITCEIYICDSEKCSECTCSNGVLDRNEFCETENQQKCSSCDENTYAIEDGCFKWECTVEPCDPYLSNVIMENARFTSGDHLPNYNGYALVPDFAIDGVTLQNDTSGDLFALPNSGAGSSYADLLLDIRPALSGVVSNYAIVYPRNQMGSNRYRTMIVIINEGLENETACSPLELYDAAYLDNAISANQSLLFNCTENVNAETVTVRNTNDDHPVSIVELQLGYKE